MDDPGLCVLLWMLLFSVTVWPLLLEGFLSVMGIESPLRAWIRERRGK